MPKAAITLQTPKKQKIELLQETDYPVSGKISIKVKLQKPEDMSLRIRIPHWSQETAVMINGESVKNIVPGTYVAIKRVWKADDVIELSLDVRGRVVEHGRYPKSVAVVRGPIVLARDSRLSNPGIESIIMPFIEKDGTLRLEPVQQKDPEMWMEFTGLFFGESYTEYENKPVAVPLCDYASAGNSKIGFPWFRVWLPQLLDPRE